MTYIVNEVAIEQASAMSFQDKALVEAITEMKSGLESMLAAQMIKAAQINLQDMIDDNDGNYQGMRDAGPQNLHNFATELTSDLFKAWQLEVTKKITELMTSK